MSDETDRRPAGGQLEAVFAVLADEQRKLAEFQEKMATASTVAESPDKMLAATFDGRGELVTLTFNNTKYRTMAPAQLAATVLDVIRRGRAAAFTKIDEAAGRDVLPGINFGELASGKVDVNEVVNTLIGSAIDLPGIAKAVKKDMDGRNG